MKNEKKELFLKMKPFFDNGLRFDRGGDGRSVKIKIKQLPAT